MGHFAVTCPVRIVACAVMCSPAVPLFLRQPTSCGMAPRVQALGLLHLRALACYRWHGAQSVSSRHCTGVPGVFWAMPNGAWLSLSHLLTRGRIGPPFRKRSDSPQGLEAVCASPLKRRCAAALLALTNERCAQAALPQGQGQEVA